MSTTTARSFTLVRRYDAPRAQVYRAWTEPEHLTWFRNPLQPTNEPIEVDLRVGGAWRVRMIVSEELVYWTGGVYLEIVPDERLVFAWGATDGWPELDLDDLRAGPVATVTFTDLGDATEMAFQVELPAHLAEEDVRRWLDLGIREGWTDTIDRLSVGTPSG